MLLNLARQQKGRVVVMTALSGLQNGFSAGLLGMGCVPFNLGQAECRDTVIDTPKSLLVKLES